MNSSTLMPAVNTPCPLVVDLDGSLTRTDTLGESLIQAIKSHPGVLFWLPFWLMSGRAVFKARLAERANLKGESLPYREEVCEFIRDERAKGRKIILATAANRNIAESVASHLALFDDVLASDETFNLKSTAKLAAIRQCVGSNFVYVGDSAADLPIWKEADAAVLVETSSRVTNAVLASTPIERQFPPISVGFTVWFRALRVHQWLKNLLVFVPLLTSFEISSINKVIAASFAFLCFSLMASATYVGNDILDIGDDRLHPRKRKRPFASAQISILKGVGVAFVILLASLALASTLTLRFFLLLSLYLVLTSAYSWVLKHYVLIDVLGLSILYSLRILAGAAAIEISTSVWLLAFSVFIFFSLALIKRCAELISFRSAAVDTAPGRDYSVSDLAILWPLGVGAGLCSVVVFTLFVSSPETASRYATPQLLWLVAVGLIYWLGRLWIKTARGEMDDDPLVYAVRDFGSLVTIAAMIAVVLTAYFLHLG